MFRIFSDAFDADIWEEQYQLLKVVPRRMEPGLFDMSTLDSMTISPGLDIIVPLRLLDQAASSATVAAPRPRPPAAPAVPPPAALRTRWPPGFSNYKKGTNVWCPHSSGARR